MKETFSFVFVLLFGIAARGAEDDDYIQDGRCLNLEPISDFNATLFDGRWYMMFHYPMYVIKDRNCVQSTFVANENGFDGEGTSVDMSSDIYNDLFTVTLTDPAVDVNDTTPASFLFETLSALPDGFSGSAKTPYQILDIDYERYACIYACQDAEVDGVAKKIEFPMAYLRDPNDASDAARACKTLFQNTIGIDWLRFMEVVHDETCIYGYDD